MTTNKEIRSYSN